MRKTVGLLLIFFGLLFAISSKLFGWGFWAHKEINRKAIDVLPKEMRTFFQGNADYLSEHAIDPDQRRYKDENEGFYHYIDIDRYGAYPFSALPHDYQAAVEKFGVGFVKKNGLVPWRIADFVHQLKEAMRKKDKQEILFYAANLGHYVADAHVPLHATENYDGQLTDQKGVHARFESDIPERYGKLNNLSVDSAQYISNPLEFAFHVILESYSFVDSVLKADKAAKEGLAESDLYSVFKKSGRTEYHYSDIYFQRFNERLHGLVEKRMQDAIQNLASFWYTAWVDAGKPGLPLP